MYEKINKNVYVAQSRLLLNMPLLHWLVMKKKRAFKWSRHTLALHNKSLNQVTLFIVWKRDKKSREKRREFRGVWFYATRVLTDISCLERDFYLAGTPWAKTYSLTCLQSCGLCTSTGLPLFLTHYTESAYRGPLLPYWQNSAETHTHTLSQRRTRSHMNKHLMI